MSEPISSSSQILAVKIHKALIQLMSDTDLVDSRSVRIKDTVWLTMAYRADAFDRAKTLLPTGIKELLDE